MTTPSNSIEWSDSLEKLFKKSAEQFLCLRWTHDAAQRWTAKQNTLLTVPVIVLSGLASLGSVGSSNLLPFERSELLIGFISFTAGILQTVSSYFAFARRAESHRIAALGYEKLYRTIDFQLKAHRHERDPPGQIMKMLKDEADRLNEVSPQIPEWAIKQFKIKFPSPEGISVPSILNGLEAVEVALETPSSSFQPDSPRVKITIKPGSLVV